MPRRTISVAMTKRRMEARGGRLPQRGKTGTVKTDVSAGSAAERSGESRGARRSTAYPFCCRAEIVSWRRRISCMSACARVEAMISTADDMASRQRSPNSMRIVRDFMASSCAWEDGCWAGTGGATTRCAPQDGHSTDCPTMLLGASSSCLQELHTNETKLLSSAICNDSGKTFFSRVQPVQKVEYSNLAKKASLEFKKGRRLFGEGGGLFDQLEIAHDVDDVVEGDGERRGRR